MFGAISDPLRGALPHPRGPSDTAAEALRHEPVTPGVSAAALFYLTTAGLAAAAIIAIFFGAGFLMLPPVGGTLSGPRMESGSDVGSRAYALLPPPGDYQPATADQAPAKAGSEAVQSSATPPSTAQASANSAYGTPSGRVRPGTLMSKTPPAEPSPSTVPGRTSKTFAALLAPANPALSGAEITALLARGDSLLHAGDIASARAFYKRAADAGDARAALRLGATFDPGFLDRARLGNMQADAAVARSWYSRALDRGAADARPPLN